MVPFAAALGINKRSRADGSHRSVYCFTNHWIFWAKLKPRAGLSRYISSVMILSRFHIEQHGWIEGAAIMMAVFIVAGELFELMQCTEFFRFSFLVLLHLKSSHRSTTT
jgi:hypothetical protein